MIYGTKENIDIIEKYSRYFSRTILYKNHPYYDDMYSECLLSGVKALDTYNPKHKLGSTVKSYIIFIMKRKAYGYLKYLQKEKNLTKDYIRISRDQHLEEYGMDIVSSKVDRNVMENWELLNFRNNFLEHLQKSKDNTKNVIEKNRYDTFGYIYKRLLIDCKTMTEIAREMGTSSENIRQHKVKLFKYIRVNKNLLKL